MNSLEIVVLKFSRHFGKCPKEVFYWFKGSKVFKSKCRGSRSWNGSRQRSRFKREGARIKADSRATATQRDSKVSRYRIDLFPWPVNTLWGEEKKKTRQFPKGNT